AREEGAKQGLDMQVLEEELNQDVDEVAERLTEKLSSLRRGKWIAAGGEPTVRVSGEGRGGRCSELAVRLGLRLRDRGIDDAWGLLASSDGLDGTAEAAGFVLCPDRYSERGHDVDVSEALARSDSVSVADRFAIPIPKNPSGNNLRDIFVVGRV
ncbi:MAG: MOFRL family protein, partial [Thermoanaerobaculia bacterium]|nr:MOFRL family protein [Thermoanaerobaculia bacterium]